MWDHPGYSTLAWYELFDANGEKTKQKKVPEHKKLATGWEQETMNIKVRLNKQTSSTVLLGWTAAGQGSKPYV